MQTNQGTRLTDENLRGRTVIAAGGKVIGEVVSIFLDCEAWRIESVRVKLGTGVADQLGADHGMFHAGVVDVPVRMIQSVGDTVVLSVPVSALRDVLPSAGEEVTAASAAR